MPAGITAGGACLRAAHVSVAPSVMPVGPESTLNSSGRDRGLDWGVAIPARLERLAGSRLTREGVLVIDAHRHRTQARNRQDALERLVDLIRRAAVMPVPRRATKPTAGARERRLESKKRRSAIKGLRQKKPALN